VDTPKYGDVPNLDVAGSHDPETGKGAIFVINRSTTDTVTTEIVWQDGKAITLDEVWQLTDTDPKAMNSWENPNRLVAQQIEEKPVVDNGRSTINLPPLSFTVLTTHTL
jgi:alpha-N-arabinofuranosidase